MFCEPDGSYHGLVYADRFGLEAFIARYQRTMGAVLAPMSAFLILQGIETVALRMERHVKNAREVAHFLLGDPRVAWVDYVGFPDSPYHELARKYLNGRAPSLFLSARRAAWMRPRLSMTPSSWSNGWSASVIPARFTAIPPRRPTGK
jgi:O-acetylhomoserine (thiol)-lyase